MPRAAASKPLADATSLSLDPYLPDDAYIHAYGAGYK